VSAKGSQTARDAGSLAKGLKEMETAEGEGEAKVKALCRTSLLCSSDHAAGVHRMVRRVIGRLARTVVRRRSGPWRAFVHPIYLNSQIASDNKGGGAAAFKAIQSLSPSGGKIMVMSVDPGISTTDARAAGFEAAAKADSKFTYLGIQYSHNDPATAAKLMTATLAKDPDIVGVFAANLFSAAGTGIRQANKQNQVKVIGFDAGPDQVAQLKGGTVQGLIAQDPYQIGVDGVDQGLASLKGQQVTKTIQTGFHVLTKDNIDGDGAQYVYKSKC
jgi:ribose transport system substrate-binding protein